jgi:hypothetical protein
VRKTPSKRSRAKAFVKRKPKLITRIANGIGLLIAFNQEIGSAIQDQGIWATQPITGFGNLLGSMTGFNAFATRYGGQGTINATQLTASIGSKVGGYAFAKIIKVLVKRMKVM